MLSQSKILDSAIIRAEHFSSALNWYAQSLKTDENFRQQFYLLANELAECARNEVSLKQVFFIAVGKSAQVAELIVSMLVSVGILARFVHPTEAYHGDLGVVGKKDTVVLISNNGRSTELTQLLPGLAEREVTIFTVTSKEDSPLAKSAKHLLLISPFSEMCPLEQAPITSTITTLALSQLLVAATVEIRNYSVAEYAKNHPGGAIGKRIFLKADDLMIKDKDLPTVRPDDQFKVVVSTFTKFSKAAVLVVENKKFLGLIAEKDLRLAIEKGPEAFSLKASQIMNIKPTVIEPGLLAVDVFRIMNEQVPPFNLLPVISKDGNAIGIVRLLDFIAAGITL